MDRSKLFELTQHIDALPVECDGASRLTHLALHRAGIIHQVMMGTVKHGQMKIPIHWWIQVGKLIIDWRCRMWSGSAAPHGIFLASEHPDYVYSGKPTSFGLDGCLILESLFCQTEL